MNLHEYIIANQSNNSQNKDTQIINVGFSLLSRVSSVPGSPVFTFLQPLINSRLFLAPWILLGSQILLLLAKHVFHLEKLTVLDIARGQRLQIPIEELQNLIRYLCSRQTQATSNQDSNFDTAQNGTDPIPFPTELPPGSPGYLAIFVSVDYTDELYTPTLFFFVPILSFPGLRGALPFLILAILAIIFVRCVVPPETTGAKPEPKPRMEQNQSFNLRSEDVTAILRRFGRFFNSP
ncbi:MULTISPECIES: hypothetical protein [Desulfitobacterium]|uniref:Uncharacterized protein n=1 Tax=Desulfitobacterium dehalogenans (strain ATCC 51507 / DSM 9161 / JW/IU-DC1) TaxID=756499 RepID=I4A9F2_DESDJ|nr:MULTISPECIES: hypothetical protein [Desulfitobacterium]AFM00587.1 hypothetical protein Desde_2241 [Desulfitobacterium dehalogenans ATCC 51507]